jgi:Tol biopolymer transport system component
MDIFVQSTAGGEARDLTGALSKNQKSFPSWSPDSKRLAYVEAKDLTLNVKVIDPDGGNPGKITDNAYTNAFPVWSPDGRRIAFVSSREGTRTEMARGDIYVMNADGSNAVNLSRHPDEDNYPAWSDDGSSIYFVSLRSGTAQIYAVPAGGGETKRLSRSDGHDLMIRPAASPVRNTVQAASPTNTP